MEIKFKKNELVRMNNIALMGIFGAKGAPEISKETYKVTQCRLGADGNVEYKLSGCCGWWKEIHLVKA